MMNMRAFLPDEQEEPLDRIPANGGYTGIFRTIACVGDSLSSGEFESLDEQGNKGYHDMFEYSWGQYIAREAGCKVYNFSRGGMTAKEYMESYADRKGYWNEDWAAQAYIMALGVNDLWGQKQPVGSVADICAEDWHKNAPTFTGYFAQIIQRYKTIQPKAKFFLVTMPRSDNPECEKNAEAQTAAMHALADYFDYTYVIDLHRYAPVYDSEFAKKFYLGGHLNPMGYMLTARMTMAYIDYIIRHNMEDFAQVPFIGQPFHNVGAKW